MDTYDNLRVDTADGIRTLTIDRPDRLNALDRRCFAELRDAVASALADDSVHGLVITGSGTRAFVAGADIEELAALGPLEAAELSRLGQTIFSEIESSPKPIVAAVNGYALGGGCELALACHLRVASETAKFGLPEVTLGLIPGYGGTVRLPRLVGKGRALEMILTGEAVDAAEALRVGLVNRVCAPDQLLHEARELLRAILTNGRIALASAIESVSRGLDLPTNDALALESKLFGLLSTTDDMHEGVTAFLEKRRAEFRGS